MSISRNDENMRILLIEDDPMIGSSLVRALQDAGMMVDWIRNGQQGEAATESGGYALVLLDLGLPEKSGYEVLQSMRLRGDATPLLIITAKDEVDDCVRGLDLGADDYIIKPFGAKELIARMRAILRRHGGHDAATISNGEITLNIATLEITYRNKSLILSAKEFSLLRALVEQPGNILTRDQIEEKLYGWNVGIESNVVEVLIHHVRRKFDNEIIRNVRGIGWMVPKHPL
jgi:DNA-binding response OmpR family regulator